LEGKSKKKGERQAVGRGGRENGGQPPSYRGKSSNGRKSVGLGVKLAVTDSRFSPPTKKGGTQKNDGAPGSKPCRNRRCEDQQNEASASTRWHCRVVSTLTQNELLRQYSRGVEVNEEKGRNGSGDRKEWRVKNESNVTALACGPPPPPPPPNHPHLKLVAKKAKVETRGKAKARPTTSLCNGKRNA